MCSTGILSLSKDLLVSLQSFVDHETRIELRTTCSRMYIVCHNNIKTIYIRNCRFPYKLRMAGFNGINFQPEAIEFKTDVTYSKRHKKFLENFGKKCKALKFSNSPGFDYLQHLMTVMPNLKTIDCPMNEPFHYKHCNEAVKHVFRQLRSFTFLLNENFELNQLTNTYEGFPNMVNRMRKIEIIEDAKGVPFWSEYSTSRLLDLIRKNQATIHTLNLRCMSQTFYETLCTMPNLRLKAMKICCEHADDAQVINLLKRQPLLETLMIRLPATEPARIVNEIGISCKKLKILTLLLFMHHISDFSFTNELNDLKNLTIASMHNDSCLVGVHLFDVEGSHPGVKILKVDYNLSFICSECLYKIIEYFPNIHTLDLDTPAFSEYSLNAICTNYKLKHLSIINSEAIDKWKPQPCWTLQTLYIEDHLCLKYFPMMPHLKKLEIVEGNFNQDHLIEFIKNCSHLADLRLSCCSGFDLDKFFGQLCLQVPNLRKFYFSHPCNFTWTDITNWQNLRRLYLNKSIMDADMVKMLFDEIPTLKNVTAVAKGNVDEFKDDDEDIGELTEYTPLVNKFSNNYNNSNNKDQKLTNAA